jgi:hypothetical protein
MEITDVDVLGPKAIEMIAVQLNSYDNLLIMCSFELLALEKYIV